MTIFDGRVDLWVSNKTPGLIDVWFRNPDEFFFNYAGVPYDPKFADLKDAIEADLGTPPPPPASNMYGVAGKFYVVQSFKSDTGALADQEGNVPGPLKVEFFYLDGVGLYTRYRRVITDGNGIVRSNNISSCGTPECTGGSPTARVLEQPNYETVPPDAGGGYPALTPADVATIADFLAGLAAIQYTATGGGGTQQIAQLTGQVNEIAQAVPLLKPAIDRIVPDLGPSLAPIPGIQTDIAEVKRKVQDILDCTCAVVLEDCQDVEIVGIKLGLQYIINTLCDVQKKLGYSPGQIVVPGLPPRELKTVREALQDIMRRTGYDNPFIEQQCGDDVQVSSIEDHVGLVNGTLGFASGVRTGGTTVTGEEAVTCTVSSALELIVGNPGELSVYRGFEVDSLPVPILKIHYNTGSLFQKMAGMQIPNPVDNVTKSQILQALGPKVSGDWLCQITFASGRKLLGWFNDALEGLAYLQLAAALSTETIIVGSGAATLNPADAPARYNGATLNPTIAFVIPTTGSGLTVRRIPLV